jgi:histidinol-phosphate aminotransferase
MNARGLEYLMRGFSELELTVVPSEANFVMLVFGSESEAEFLARELLKLGIIIRPLRAFGLPNCVRITVGTDDENGILLAAMKQIFSTAPASARQAYPG